MVARTVDGGHGSLLVPRPDRGPGRLQLAAGVVGGARDAGHGDAQCHQPGRGSQQDDGLAEGGHGAHGGHPVRDPVGIRVTSNEGESISAVPPQAIVSASISTHPSGRSTAS